MSLNIGHEDCFKALDNILRAYEEGKYKRLVQYGPGQSILFDSNPAPGYVPGIPGKKESGIEYVPKVDGTKIHIFYVAGKKADARAEKEAARAVKSGFDSHEILGTLVSIRKTPAGSIQLQFVAANRDVIEDTTITDKVALRSVSITDTPSKKGGIIVAMAFDQTLGIPDYQLKALLESEEIENLDVTALSNKIREASEAKGIPEALKDPAPKPEVGATGEGEEVPQ